MIRAGVDWGSSSFRAYQFGDCENVIETVDAPIGIKFVDDDKFEQALFNQIGSWLSPGDSVLLSGMITSRNGWFESPYIECPADLSHTMTHAVKKTVPCVELIFLPGLCQRHPQPDVMRGEELQLLGASLTTESQVVVLPGTHSKWAITENGGVKEFRTIATGEVFEVLRKHSLVGAFASDEAWSDKAFLDGVITGFDSSTIVTQLFTCRSSVLLAQRAPADTFSFMSGLLVGNEIREGMDLLPHTSSPLMLIGTNTLCERYRLALEYLSIGVINAQPDAAARGFTSLIKSLNLQP